MADSKVVAKPAPKIDTAQIEQDASWIGKRLSEPSTYAGLGILLAALFHLTDAPALAGNIQSIGVGIGMVILGALAIVKAEKSK